MLARNDHFACLWAGDSRAYLLRDGALQQITRDHSLVQELVESGVIRPEEAEHHPRANVITRAVGADLDEFALDKVSGRIQVGDRFLLCSDGLCKTVPEDESGEPVVRRCRHDAAGGPDCRGAGTECNGQRHRGRGRGDGVELRTTSPAARERSARSVG